MTLLVEIVTEGSEPRAVEVTGQRVTVGSGPRAELVIDGAGLPDEHFAVEPHEDGCRVVLLAEGPPLLAEGRPHADGVLPWGTELGAGGARVRLVRGAAAAPRRLSPILLLGPVAIGVALFAALSDDAVDAIGRPPEAPPLLEPEEPSCQSGASPARHRAERDEEAAAAKGQRYPFAPADGVEAVRLYRHAAACFAATGDLEGRERASERARRVAQRAEADYDTARFRLERALARQDWPAALVEAQTLLAFLGGRRDPYVEWLTMLERRLRLAGAAESRSGP